MKFRTKVLVLAFVVAAACLTTLVQISLNYQKSHSTEGVERQVLMVKNFLEHFLLPAMSFTDQQEYNHLLDELAESIPVAYIHIYDQKNQLVTARGEHSEAHQHDSKLNLSEPFEVYDQILTLPENPLGLREIHYGVSVTQYRENISTSSLSLYAFVLFGILIMVIGAYLALRVYSRALSALRHASLRISEGDFTHRLSEKECRGLEQTARAFNLMCEKLECYEAEQKREHLRLKELSLAVENSPVSVLMTDHRGVITYVNPSFLATTGYDKDDVIGKTPRLLKSGVNDRDEYIDLWQTIKAGKVWRGELVNRRKDGSLFWDKTMIAPVTTEQDGVTHFIAVKEDVTEYKQIEKRMRAAKTVFDAASEAIMVTDLNGTITMVNPAFFEITGYAETEIVGKNPRLLHSGHHDETFYLEMFKQLQRDNRWEGEIWNRRKSGEVYPQWQTISMVRDEEGEPLEYIALFSDISKRKEQEDKIRYRANYDALTQLANRSLFSEQLEQQLKQAKREQYQQALFYLDLDGFKAVNDSYGHYVGDCVLKQVADILRETVRESDSICRMGGDEFVISLSRITDLQAIEVVAEKLIAVISEPMSVEGHTINIGTSIGISLYPSIAETPKTLIATADKAMYKAKRGGKNRFFVARERETASS